MLIFFWHQQSEIYSENSVYTTGMYNIKDIARIKKEKYKNIKIIIIKKKKKKKKKKTFPEYRDGCH